MPAVVEAIPTIDRDELKQMIERGERFVLLETLSPEHFQVAHLPGARNAPPAYLAELAPRLIPDHDTPVVTYCTGPACGAAARAARMLRALGYRDVRHYPGGKQDWIGGGLPVEGRRDSRPAARRTEPQ
jgi:rhodanese-related sulfurtransferase